MIKLVDVKRINDGFDMSIASAVERVIARGHFIRGPECETFQAEFAKYCGVRSCAAVSNGLDAIKLALKALDLEPMSGVVIPANTYTATAMAIADASMTPVLCDVSPETFLASPEMMLKAFDGWYDDPKCFMPVYLTGMAPDMIGLSQIADRLDVPIVADAAQAHGLRYRDQPIAKWADASTFSFYPGKNLGALGDAGAIVSNKQYLMEKALQIANQGQTAKYDHEYLGVNARMDEIQAAVLREKLKTLSRANQERRMAATIYRRELDGVGDLQFQALTPGSTHVYHLFVVLTNRRDALAKFLRDHEIETGVHYPTPVHLQPAFRWLGYKHGDFPVAERLAETSLSLPMHQALTISEQDQVISRIRQFFAS